MNSHKELPKKLEEDLDKIRNYKPTNPSVSQNKSISAIMDDSVERAMYDEILGPLLNRSVPKTTVSLGNTHRVNSNTTGSSTDFTTTLLTRLKTVESEAKEVRRKLVEQIAYNGKLEREIVDLKSLAIEPQDVLDDLEIARQQNRNLQQKIREMEKFLADYGLEWVGHRSNDGDDHDNDNEDDDDLVGSTTHHVSFADFNKHIQELNSVVYSEPAQVVTEGTHSRKAHLVQASELVENIKVVYYRNGLFIQRGPFRPCDSDTYTSFVEDILDGYFPSEFRSAYPDGVTFDLKDRHDIEYREGHSSHNHEHHPHMAARQFLDRLPKTVIRNGELVDIRGDVESRLNGGGGAKRAATAGEGATSSSLANAKGAAADAAESRAQAKQLDSVAHPSHKIDRPDKPVPIVAPSAVVGSKAGTVVLSTPAAAELASQRNASSSGGADFKTGDEKDSSVAERVVQVQVKWTESSLTGGVSAQQQLLLVHMYEHDTVRDLRAQIAQWVEDCDRELAINDNVASVSGGLDRVSTTTSTQRFVYGPGESVAIELRNAYPPRVLSDAYTLREAGLVPNGTVHAKRL